MLTPRNIIMSTQLFLFPAAWTNVGDTVTAEEEQFVDHFSLTVVTDDSMATGVDVIYKIPISVFLSDSFIETCGLFNKYFPFINSKLIYYSQKRRFFFWSPIQTQLFLSWVIVSINCNCNDHSEYSYLDYYHIRGAFLF